MNTTPVNTPTARLAKAIADPRDTARAFLEDLRQPTITPGEPRTPRS